LIGKPTVNTVPQQTLDAFLDHGVVEESLTQNIKAAEDVIETLKSFGIDINAVCAKLLDEGVVSFEKSFDSLLQTIEIKNK
jgi:transaldolase/transaldolase/glucose-6-phosphate isomerase